MQLHIFWDGSAPEGLAVPVARLVSRMMELPAPVSENPVVFSGYSESRKQTNAIDILDRLDLYRRRKELPDRVLLVTRYDLFRPGLDFLFGLARPSAGVAVVSTERLGNGYYGRPENDCDLVDRCAKESAHEFGHLFHLDHCAHEECIMYNPRVLDDLDRKEKQFCRECRSLLDEAISRGD